MSENDQLQQFLPDDNLNSEGIVVKTPTDPNLYYQDKVLSGYEPMSGIYLGIASRGLAGGRIPWWVLISGWIIFGGLALLILIPAIASVSFTALPALIIVAIPLIILWRGTTAKFFIGKHKSRRR
jgi:hypothetical protein